MKEFLNKSCKLTINISGKLLFFTAQKVVDVSNTHITFIDKFDYQLSYRVEDIVEIQELR